ncbi:hypothetical protein AVEN_265016-1 [Araneus ventricosus]|uniref:Uncharacterized protein n=1 Tax=Araneus ventricosus TaxID=182803 RepID=A0A4Y2EHE1_ARAVE|nr:hypothetical protein AVEN_265016-1 [Araneus ventricosus]
MLNLFRYNPESNFSLQQRFSDLALEICKLAASLTRQECKIETSYCKRRSHYASNLQQVNPLQTIAKKKESPQTNLRFEPPTTRLLDLSP